VTSGRTRSQIGKANRRKGAVAERDLVKYLRNVGFGGAERAVRTGYRTATRVAADPGDITGTPGIVWSVKDTATERLDQWLAELDAMAAGLDDVRLLVHKRRGHADPGRWWCWLRASTLIRLLDNNLRPDGPGDSAPLRMELRHVIRFLRAAGYGDQLDGQGAA